MSEFHVQIACDNSAFGDEPNVEIARILRQIASKLDNGHDVGAERDANGSMVGGWWYQSGENDRTNDDALWPDDAHQEHEERYATSRD